jgi:hypothetical protein
MSVNNDDDDKPIWHASGIAGHLNILKEDGTPNAPKVLWHLRQGHLRHRRMGRLYYSTPRLLREGETTPPTKS